MVKKYITYLKEIEDEKKLRNHVEFWCILGYVIYLFLFITIATIFH